jgi:cytochrome c-type protein NapC
MTLSVLVLFGLIGLAAVLLLLLAFRPSVTRRPEGKILAFMTLVVAPGLALAGGAMSHLDHSKSTEFCLSCHVMEKYGKSLHVDDKEFLAAQHYQNNRVPRDHACFTCHTDYAMFGGVRAKLRGLRHVSVQYFGKPPEKIKLYTPYNNRECLHCHLGSRSFEESSGHRGEDVAMADLKSGKTSCLSAGCHDVAHGVDELEDAEFWEPAKTGGAEAAPAPTASTTDSTATEGP